jgi:hypothetical protein
VVAPGSADAAGQDAADERAAKKLRQQEPAAAAAAAAEPYIGSAVLAQRQASLRAAPLTAEEREQERQRQREREQQQQPVSKQRDGGSSKSAKDPSSSKKSRDKSAKLDKPGSASPAAAAATAAKQTPPADTAAPTPAAAGLLDAVPDRLKGRLGLPVGSAGAAAAAASSPASAAAAAGGGEAAGDRWQPGMEDGMQLLPNPSREQQQRLRQQQQQPAANGAATGRGRGSSSGSGAAGFLTPDDAPIFDEFCEVWFWRDEGAEIGPKSIRDLRRLVKNLPGDLLTQMNNTECYTKQAKPEHKLLKHLLRFGNAEAPQPGS